MPRDYLNFDLLVVSLAGHYQARVIASPAGQATAEFALPGDAGELARLWSRAGRSQRHLGSAPAGQPELADGDLPTAGARLFDALFAGAVGQAFLRSLDEARRRAAGLRLRLRMGDAPELAALPWEYMYAAGLGRFLALSDETPLVRYLELAQPERPLAVRPPLRVLAVVSDPPDALPLDVEREWEHLRSALHELQARHVVHLDRLEQPTLPALQQALRRQDVHILHFIGHGFFDEAAQTGGLVFEQESGKRLDVTAVQLGTILHDQRALRLVFLNACHGARGSATMPFAGVAQRLVQQNVPTVLAMQFAVTDTAAIALAHEFYRALADGLAVDEATSEARKAIYAAGEPFEWGTPVLFTHAPDGVILAPATEEEAPMQESAAPPWWQQIRAAGDVIIASVGAGASNVAVGKGITQQVTQLLGPPAPDDRQIILQKLSEIDAALAAQPSVADAGRLEVAKLQLQLLRGELAKTAEGETPSASAITLAGSWLLDNLPSMRSALAHLFATPAAGRVLAKAGEDAVTWAKERLGGG
jgi:hypothetical protein